MPYLYNSPTDRHCSDSKIGPRFTFEPNKQVKKEKHILNNFKIRGIKTCFQENIDCFSIIFNMRICKFFSHEHEPTFS